MLLREAGAVSKSASTYTPTTGTIRNRITKLAHRNSQRGAHRLLLVKVLDGRRRLANRVQRLAHRLADLVHQCFPRAPLVAFALISARAVSRELADTSTRERARTGWLAGTMLLTGRRPDMAPRPRVYLAAEAS